MESYKSFSKKVLNGQPWHVQLGNFRVEYMAFSRDARVEDKAPVVILVGDFQRFNSFREFVPKLYKTRPVIIVSLPSYGGNTQRADALSMEEMAALLGRFVDALGLPAIDLISFSLNSLLAHEFAIQFSDKVNRLIVSGIMASPRRSFLMTLEESISMMEDNFENFSDALLLYLFNPRFLSEDEPGDSKKALPYLSAEDTPCRRLLRQRIKQLDDNQKAQYKSNTKRVLNYLAINQNQENKLSKFPLAETLVLAGEFDHFVLPFETAEYASQCNNAEFVLIKNADHLIQADYMGSVLSVVNRFLKQKSLKKTPGVKMLRPDQMATQGKRSSLRREPVLSHAWLCSESLRMHQAVCVKDINYSGGLMELPRLCMQQATQVNDLELHFSGFELKLKVAVFDRQNNIVRFLFKHTDIEKAKQLILMLSNNHYFLPPKAGDSGVFKPF